MLVDRYKHKQYQSGLKFVLYVTVRELYKCDVFFEHSLDKGLYCKIMTDKHLTNEDITLIDNKMKEIISQDLKITRKVVTKKDAYDFYLKTKEYEKARNVLNLNNKTVTIYELLGYYNYFMDDMVPSTGVLSNYRLTYLNNNDLVLSTIIDETGRVPAYTSQDMILKSYTDYQNWCHVQNVSYVSDLNQIVSESKIKEFIKKNDIMMDNQVYDLARVIKEINRKIILLGGPSSSGKTTSTRKLALYLTAIGLNPIYLGLDDYFKERSESPKDENGEYDFETLDCIDLELFNNQLTSLLNGEEVLVPTFTVDIRLLRRIVRDNRTRGYNVIDTLKSWEKVRNGETKYVFPFTNEANVILNTAYIYEMGILKVYVEPLLYSVPMESKFYNEARRLINELQMFFPIPSEYLSDTNILREFIGESYF